MSSREGEPHAEGGYDCMVGWLGWTQDCKSEDDGRGGMTVTRQEEEWASVKKWEADEGGDEDQRGITEG